MSSLFSKINLKDTLLFIVILISVLSPAFFNGYPLVTSDTGIYITSGFNNLIPEDRPIFYGLMVRHLSLSDSLWFVVIFQALIISYLIIRVINIYLPYKISMLNSLFIILGLTYFTSVGWVSSQIMADALTPLGVLSMAILIRKTNLSIVEIVFNVIILVYSTISHNSHLITNTLVVVFIFIFYKFSKENIKLVISQTRIYAIILAVFSAWIIAPTANYLISNEFKLSGSAHAFIAAKMIEDGIMGTFLNEYCEKQSTELKIPGRYVIYDSSSLKCWDIKDFSEKDSADLQLWSFLNGVNQQFIVLPAKNNWIRIQAVHSNKFLSVIHLDNEWKVIQNKIKSDSTSLFKLIKKDGNSYSLYSASAKKYLCLEKKEIIDGTYLNLSDISNLNDYNFKFFPVQECKLCLFRNKLPNNTIDFLWNESPFNREGGFKGTKSGYSKLLIECLTTYKYFIRFIGNGVIGTLRLLVNNDIGDGLLIYKEGSSPFSAISEHFPNEINTFINSRQNRSISFDDINKRWNFILFLSTIVVLFTLFSVKYKKENPEIYVLVVIFTLGIFLNAFTNGTFANVISRLQSRISWLIVFVTIIIVIKFLNDKNVKQRILEFFKK